MTRMLDVLTELNNQYIRDEKSPETRKIILKVMHKSHSLFCSEIWAESCVNSLRFFRETKRYPYTKKNEKVMKRGKN